MKKEISKDHCFEKESSFRFSRKDTDMARCDHEAHEWCHGYRHEDVWGCPSKQSTLQLEMEICYYCGEKRQEVSCFECHGTGILILSGGKDCERCSGTGKVWRSD